MSEQSPKFNPTSEALDVLDQVLDDAGAQAVIDEAVEAGKIEALDVLHEDQVIHTSSTRLNVRMMLVTADMQVFEQGSGTRSWVDELRQLFAELHVVVIAHHPPVAESQRLDDHTWLYVTQSKKAEQHQQAFWKVLNNQLTFSNVFRPDAIIADGVEIAGECAVAAGEHFKRPTQIHIRNNIAATLRQYGWFARMRAKRAFCSVLERSHSIRVRSHAIEQYLHTLAPAVSEVVEVIPPYVDLRSITSYTPTFSLKERYPTHRFSILHIPSESTIEAVLHAVRAVSGVVRRPQVGLFVYAPGLDREACYHTLKETGVAENVILLGANDNLFDYYANASAALFLEQYEGYDTALITAAAAGAPIVAYTNDLVDQLFVHGESALICEAGREDCIQYILQTLLNQNTIRVKLSRYAKIAVKEQLVQDVEQFQLHIRDSIERMVNEYGTTESE